MSTGGDSSSDARPGDRSAPANAGGRLRGLAGAIRLDGGPVGILLVHGLGGTPVEMRFLAQQLNRDGFTVHCPLLKGHGGSDLLLNTTTWRDWLASVMEAHEALARDCEVVLVGGISAGAMLALHLAAERPDRVSGLMLMSPTFWPNGWAIPGTLHLFRLIRQKWLADLFNFSVRQPFGIKDERTRRFVIESLMRDGRDMRDVFGRRGGTLLEFRRMVRAGLKRLGRIRQPALIIHSREDDQSDLSSALVLQRRLTGPVEAVILNDCYHMIVLDRQRSVVAERVAAFAKAASAVALARLPAPATDAESDTSAQA
ncbi:MAG: alpha/beta fold hydrolase [Hyphomicrobiaceae bacterium]